MDITTLIGFGLAAMVMGWGVFSSGIGDKLLNAHGIVIVLGGTIAADSSTELTRFTILIPLDTVHDTSSAQNLPD